MSDHLSVDGRRPAVARVAALPASWTNETERLVLLALACDSFDGETTAPGYDQLARWTGLHRGTVYEVVRRLLHARDNRPALLERSDTRKGGRRTRLRLLLPEPSCDAGRSEPSSETGRSTVGEPSPYRPASQDGQPSSYRPASQDTPSPPSNIPSLPVPTTVELEVRAALLEKGIGEGEIDELVKYAGNDPATNSLRRLTTAPRYLSVARKAVSEQSKQRDRETRRTDAATKLDAMRPDIEAGPIIERLEDSYPDDPVGLYAAVTVECTDRRSAAS